MIADNKAASTEAMDATTAADDIDAIEALEMDARYIDWLDREAEKLLTLAIDKESADAALMADCTATSSLEMAASSEAERADAALMTDWTSTDAWELAES